MGLKIEDGTGKGYEAEVNEHNRLVVEAIVTNDQETINGKGFVWNIPLDAVAPSGATYFLYLLNTGAVDLHVSLISLNSSAAGVFRVEKVTGTAAGGTAVTVSSMHTGLTIVPDATIQTGASITGLTLSSLIGPLYLQANVPRDYQILSDIILPTNTAIALKAPGAATVNGFLTIYQD